MQYKFNSKTLKYSEFSNFAPKGCLHNTIAGYTKETSLQLAHAGKVFDTVEALYQYEKALFVLQDLEYANRIVEIQTPSVVKKMTGKGAYVKYVFGKKDHPHHARFKTKKALEAFLKQQIGLWEQGLRDQTMRLAIALKFDPVKHPVLCKALLATGDGTMGESQWKRSVWTWSGDNLLGKFLMERRAELKAIAA